MHLSELIVEARSEVKTPRFFEWSKLILFDFDSIDRCDMNRGLFGRRPSGPRVVVCCNWSYGIDLEGSRRVQLASWRKPYFDVPSF